MATARSLELARAASGSSAALPVIKSGKVRPIAQLSLHRSPYLPDLPTVAEQGATGFDYSSWQGFITTAGTPAAVLNKLQGAIAAHASTPEALSRAARDGSELVGSAPDILAKTIAEETARWKKVVRDNNITQSE